MLEYIVRPFQAPNAHGTIIIPATPKASGETAVLTWGGESTLPAVQFTEVGFKFASCKEDNIELRRDTQTVRITGPAPVDNEPSYIDVERSNKLYLKKTSDKSGQNPSTAGDTQYSDDSGFGDFSPSQVIGHYKEACGVTMSLSNNTSAA